MAQDEAEEPDADEDEDVPLGNIQRTCRRETISNLLQEAQKEDGITKILDFVQNIHETVKHMSIAIVGLQKDMKRQQEETARDRNLMKKIYLELQQHRNHQEASTPSTSSPRLSTSPPPPSTSSSTPSTSIPTPSTPSSSTSTMPRNTQAVQSRPMQPPETPRARTPQTSHYAPRYISAPTAGKLQLGGDPELERDVNWYTDILTKVGWRKKLNTDEERGRMLCMKLLRCEFSEEELRRQNVTGSTRNDSHKIVRIEKLDDRVMTAIFNQARYQFPDFKDSHNSKNCKTVKELNVICKRARNQPGNQLAQGERGERVEDNEGNN